MQLIRLVRVCALVIGALALVTCRAGSNPTWIQPTPPATPAPPRTAALSVTGVSIQGHKTSSGYRYNVTVAVRESAGVSLTISGVDFDLSANGSSLGTTHVDAPFSAKVSANSSATSRSLTVNDDNAGHSYATHVNTTVVFTDDNQNAGTATGSDDISPLPRSPSVAR